MQTVRLGFTECRNAGGGAQLMLMKAGKSGTLTPATPARLLASPITTPTPLSPLERARPDLAGSARYPQSPAPPRIHQELHDCALRLGLSG